MQTNKIAFQYGLIATLGITIFNVLLLVMNPEYAFGPFAYAAVLILIIAMCVAVIRAKKENDNYIAFKNAFTVVFIIAIIASLGNIIYSNLIMPLILPNYIDVIKSVALKNIDWMFQKMTATQEVKDKAIDDALAQIEKMRGFHLGEQIKAFFIGILFNSLIGCVIALILKSKGEKPAAPVLESEVESPGI